MFQDKSFSEVEFRVRPVTRYIVTKYTKADSKKSSENLGEFPNVGLANSAASALAKDHKSLSYDNVYYRCYSHEYDETEFENNGLILVE